MKKMKNFIVAVIAIASMSAAGILTFAAHWGSFNLTAYGFTTDSYFDLSRGLQKHDDWNTNALVTIQNVLPASAVGYLCVTADENWPESNIISEEWRFNQSGQKSLQYDIYSNHLNNVSNNTVYLLLTTGEEEININGFWTA